MRAVRWLALLHEIADRADELALRGFRSPHLQVEEKADHSPVSEVDKAIEAMARELARERHPGLGVFGEEQGDDPGTSGARLIVDPIDGTVSFVRGIPVFGTLLAIEAEGEVVAGLRSRPPPRTRMPPTPRHSPTPPHSPPTAATDRPNPYVPAHHIRHFFAHY